MKVLRLLAQLSFLFILLSFAGCNTNNSKVAVEDEKSFTFVFMTDIHLQPEKNATEGFNQAIDSVNKLNPDFVITGGDLVMDVLGQDFERSEMLYNLYNESLQRFNMPVYNTMGNHEIFGIYKESGVGMDHPEYGEKMYEKRIGKRYYSFDHKGYHFMILDGIEDTGESSYIGKIDSIQMEWIRSDLEKLNPEIPIVVSVHIPFITVVTQLQKGSLEPNRETTVITNSKEVLALFEPYNLKLVLQGHLHFLEDIYANGTHFITSGAVSSAWWSGTYNGMEEGFLLIKVSGDDFEWEYVDYGWEAAAE
ncbi:MAG: metallophosphoesterase [Bacteroidales bacterium]|nr:metallophosphoesterase [Bacteroidales bacterium]